MLLYLSKDGWDCGRGRMLLVVGSLSLFGAIPFITSVADTLPPRDFFAYFKSVIIGL